MSNNLSNILKSFRKKIAKEVSAIDYQESQYDDLAHFPLNEKQCLYVFHWGRARIIYERGLQRLTGYSVEEYNLEDMMQHVHPHDRYFVSNITKEAVKHTYGTDTSQIDTRLLITFRFRKKDGSYIKLLRQTSSYEKDVNGKMISNFSLLTDITFIDSADRVEWDLSSNELDIEMFKKKIYGIYKGYFTDRENEIILHMAKGLTSNQIAERLFISKHTVATHRKKILRKAGVGKASDLIHFCKKNGIID